LMPTFSKANSPKSASSEAFLKIGPLIGND
jgi:hypothetical protein